MMIFTLIIISVTASSIAQLLLKIGMSSAYMRQVLDRGELLPTLFATALNPLIIGGLSIYFLGAVIWLFVLSKIQLSIAYPFVALGFVITAVLSRLFIGETFTIEKTIGTAFIITGVFVLARAAASGQ